MHEIIDRLRHMTNRLKKIEVGLGTDYIPDADSTQYTAYLAPIIPVVHEEDITPGTNDETAPI